MWIEFKIRIVQVPSNDEKMNSSNNGTSNLVLTRKLTPTDRQRRTQLIANAAKIITHNNKSSSCQRSSSFFEKRKSLGCLGGNGDSNMSSKGNPDQTDHTSTSNQRNKISSIDLLDTGKV